VGNIVPNKVHSIGFGKPHRNGLRIRCLLLLALSVRTIMPVIAASSDPDSFSGTYPGRILTELALHRKFAAERARSGFSPERSLAAAPVDSGNVAVIPDDGSLVLPANRFDLDQKGILFQPAAGGYTIAASAGGFDSSAASNGLLLNPGTSDNPDNIGDDGTREVPIGFAFPYFGKTYTTVFINSDGNLTFGQGDTSTSKRSLARFLVGAPRIAPFFSDLDPSVGGRLTLFSSASRFVVTWSQVPDYSASGFGPSETFQVALAPDGQIQFAFDGMGGREAVVGVSPGNFTGLPALADLSAASGERAGEKFDGPAAEVFTSTTQLDLAAVGQRFYQTHEDAYEYLVVFTTFNFDLGAAFAFELNISNQVTGLGRIAAQPIFDFSRFFGSSRLSSVVNMANLGKYPTDPSAVFFRGVDSTLSILGQETGHRFLAYAAFNDPSGISNSNALLGRDLQHWSFLFNSDASVEEGNRIRDNGDGTFTTTGAVEHYSDLDQYLMGLLPPSEVPPSFLVVGPAISPARAPQRNVTFSGKRQDISLDQIVASSGPRFPNSVISPKRFNFAFVLVVPKGQSPSPEEVAHVDSIRTAWERFFSSATSFRAFPSTSLVRGLRVAPNPIGLFPGGETRGTVELLSPADRDTMVSLAGSDASVAAMPASVTIPAGSRSAEFPIAALAPGRATVTASAPGFEIGSAVVEVLSSPSDGSLSLSPVSGDWQTGPPGAQLPQPLAVHLQDSNQIPFAGAAIEFAVLEGTASLTSPSTQTDAQGNASTLVVVGNESGPVTMIATVAGTSLSAKFTLGISQPEIAPAVSPDPFLRDAGSPPDY